MSSMPKRRPSTLAAAKFAAAQQPWGAIPDPRDRQRSESAPTTGAGRSLSTTGLGPSARGTGAAAAGRTADARMNGRADLLIPGASAFSMPGTLSARGAAGSAMSGAGSASSSASFGAARSASAGAISSAPRRPSAVGKGAPSAARERQDNIVVTSLIVAFVLLTLGIGSLQIRGDMTVERSRTAISQTLASVHQRQSTFRALNQRFATWGELEDAGMKLGPRQVIVASNATAYHWFLSVRDSSTGVVCSRTGELFDDGPDDRRAACSGRGL